MNLETNIFGIQIKNPIIIGSSSLTNSVANIKKCEESGAGAVVLKSLYEEQITIDNDLLVEQEGMYQWYPEAVRFLDSISKEEGTNRYLELIKECKSQVDIPVIGSINCFSLAEWTKFASNIENAGADALELNISILPLDSQTESATIEKKYIDILQSVKNEVKIPVSIKISSYFTNIKLVAEKLDNAGAAGLVLFNRFYRPDIDIDGLRMTTRDTLSGPEEMTIPLRWVGLLSDKVKCDLIASTGIHNAQSIIKQLLAGAKAAQLCTILYENGIGYLSDIISDLTAWMRRKGFNDISSFRGLINEDPHNSLAWERIHYMKKTSGNIIKPLST